MVMKKIYNNKINFDKEHITHLLIIPDGFRRFAKKKKISTKRAYGIGSELGLKLLKTLYPLNISEISYFLISTRTLTREKEIIKYIFNALDNFLQKLLDILKNGKYNYQVCHYGNRVLLPQKTKYLLDEIKKLDIKSNKKLNLLIGFSGSNMVVSYFWTVQ